MLRSDIRSNNNTSFQNLWWRVIYHCLIWSICLIFTKCISASICEQVKSACTFWNLSTHTVFGQFIHGETNSRPVVHNVRSSYLTDPSSIQFYKFVQPALSSLHLISSRLLFPVHDMGFSFEILIGIWVQSFQCQQLCFKHMAHYWISYIIRIFCICYHVFFIRDLLIY